MSDSNPTCTSCPSYLKSEDVASRFKKNIGAPMCGKYGHVLGSTKMTPRQTNVVIRTFAKNCDSHGDPMPGVPVTEFMHVSTGDPTVTIAGMPSDAEKNLVSSCSGCANYVEPSAVVREYGWGAGMCAQSGRLIMSHRMAVTAKNCDWRRPGASRTDTAGIFLNPVYDEAFSATSDPATLYLKNKGKPITAPQDYSTDKPVEEIDRQAGVRAWRALEDPTGTGNLTYLPIYDLEMLPEDERSLVPMLGDDEHPEDYADFQGAVYKVAVLWRELDMTPMVWGIAGTGKTELFRHMAYLMGLPFARISITGASEIDEIAGKMLAADGSTYFQYGRLPKRWTRAGVNLIDEPNTGPDEVWQFIRPLTDDSKQLALDMNNGEILVRHPDAYLGMAANPAHDIRNVGAQEISDADQNRLMHIKFDLPPDAVEREIIARRCEKDGYTIDPDHLDLVMKVAVEVRALTDTGALPISWGLRPQLKVARALRWFSPKDAYALGVTDFLEAQQAEMIMDVVKSYTEGM